MSERPDHIPGSRTGTGRSGGSDGAGRNGRDGRTGEDGADGGGGRDGADGGGGRDGAAAGRAPVAVAELSPDGRIAAVNDTFAALAGYPPEQLYGRSVGVLFPVDAVAALAAGLPGPEPDERRAVGAETAAVPLATAGGDAVPCELQLQPAVRGVVDVADVADVEGDEGDGNDGGDGADDGGDGNGGGDGRRGFVAVVRPAPSWGASGEEADDAALAESFLALAEAIPDGVVVLDTDGTVRYANPAVEAILGHAPEELVGGSELRIVPPRLRDVHLAAMARYLATGERGIDWSYAELPGQHADGREIPLGISLNEFRLDGERYFVGLFRDVTPRKRAEREALRRLAQQEAIAGMSRNALETTEVDRLLTEAADRLAEVLDAPVAAVMSFDPDAGDLTLRAVHGLPADLVGTTLPASALGIAIGRAGLRPAGSDPTPGGPDPTSEPGAGPNRFDLGGELLAELVGEGDGGSGIGVTVGPPDGPWGVLAVLDDEPREFGGTDVHILESVANVLVAAVDRRDRIRKIESQRAQLNAITQVYRVVEEIQRAVIEQADRAGIERTVCERLVDLEPYAFAWIADLDLSAGTLTPREHAGDGEGYLEAVNVPAIGDAPGPGGEALRTGETQVVADVATDETFRPWRDAALEYGFRSVAAVPITYQGITFGILGIYAGEPDAFGPEVRDVLDTLGELLGHAFTAISQRRALYSDEVTEIELRVSDLIVSPDPSLLAGRRLEFDRVIPVGDDRFLMYASTTVPAEEVPRLGTLTAVESVSLLSDSGEERRVELALVDPPIGTLVSAAGGRVRGGLLEDDAMTVTVALPPTAEVKPLVDQLRAENPDATVTLRQRVTRERTPRSGEDPDDVLTALTERQRTALEAAYAGGYFEWPRENTGGEIAASLGVAGATFSNHLRGAERRVFGRLLGDRDAPDGADRGDTNPDDAEGSGDDGDGDGDGNDDDQRNGDDGDDG